MFKKKLVVALLAGAMVFCAAVPASAVYEQKNTSWYQNNMSGKNISIFGGTWDYGMTYVYTSWSQYYHPTKTHRASASSLDKGWYTVQVPKGQVAYATRHSREQHKLVACARD